MGPNTIVDLFPTAHIVLLLGDLLYILALIFLPKPSSVLLIQLENQKIVCVSKPVQEEKGRVGKNQPTTKTKVPTQLLGDLEPTGIFVCAGKVVHDFGHQLNDMLLLQGKGVFFSQPRMGIMRTMTMPSYIVSEKRAPLWLILLETTMRTFGFVLRLSHSPAISLFCLFLFSSVPFLSLTLLSLTFFPHLWQFYFCNKAVPGVKFASMSRQH